MNRLNLMIYLLNCKCREHLYAIRCMNDKEEERKRKKEIVMLVEEKEVWEGIRDSVRGRVKGE